MNQTFDKRERPIWGYGSGWTGADTEFATDTWIVVDGLIIDVQGCIYDDRSQTKMGQPECSFFVKN